MYNIYIYVIELCVLRFETKPRAKKEIKNKSAIPCKRETKMKKHKHYTHTKKKKEKESISELRVAWYNRPLNREKRGLDCFCTIFDVFFTAVQNTMDSQEKDIITRTSLIFFGRRQKNPDLASLTLVTCVFFRKKFNLCTVFTQITLIFSPHFSETKDTHTHTQTK